MTSNLHYSSTIDVRKPEEFNIEHLPDAINIPLYNLFQALGQIKQLRKPTMLYCRNGNRSGMAVTFLKQNGIPDVINGGGIDNLKQNN